MHSKYSANPVLFRLLNKILCFDVRYRFELSAYISIPYPWMHYLYSDIGLNLAINEQFNRMMYATILTLKLTGPDESVLRERKE